MDDLTKAVAVAFETIKRLEEAAAERDGLCEDLYSARFSRDTLAVELLAREARIKHLERCLIHISDTTNDPELAQFAFRASGDPPDAFPPEVKNES